MNNELSNMSYQIGWKNPLLSKRVKTYCTFSYFSGGVYTTASAFRNTRLIERLQKRNVKFEVLEQSDL